MKQPVVQRVIPLAFSLLCLGGGIAGSVVSASEAAAVVAHTAMAPVTITGKFVKTISKASFSVSSGKKSYVVKVDDMTHIKDGTKSIKLSSLRRGESVTVKGPLEMNTISATSVTVDM